MRVRELRNPNAPELADFRDLTDVALRSRAEPERGIYLAESAKVISRAIAAGHRPKSVIMEPKFLESLERTLAPHDVEVFLGSPAVLESLTGFHVHRGAIAAMHRPALPSVSELLADAHRVVILEDIVDHSNVGAAFRAVAGLGADAVLVSPRCADPLYRRSVRVSMGAVLNVPWTRLPEWPEARPLLKGAGFHISALALSDAARTLDDLAATAPERLALVFGSEGHGLSQSALAQADDHVVIPMSHGIDSLNVASACAVALWAVRR